MKFEAKTIASIISSTALATMIGMGSAHAQDANQGAQGGAAPQELPQGGGGAPPTDQGGQGAQGGQSAPAPAPQPDAGGQGGQGAAPAPAPAPEGQPEYKDDEEKDQSGGMGM